jgi:RNA polymerase sigma factor (sigma-70 family)
MKEDRVSRTADYFLWERFKGGDKEALSEIYYSYYPTLYNYGLQISSHASFIEDNIQELFYELISKTSTLGTTDNIRFYLLASFRRKVFSKLKKEQTYNYAPEDPVIKHSGREDSPEEKWITREYDKMTSKKLRIIMDNLSSREREAVYLKYYKNMSYREITEIMGINYKSARMLVYRAIRSLREKGEEAFKDERSAG